MEWSWLISPGEKGEYMRSPKFIWRYEREKLWEREVFIAKRLIGKLVNKKVVAKIKK